MTSLRKESLTWRRWFSFLRSTTTSQIKTQPQPDVEKAIDEKAAQKEADEYKLFNEPIVRKIEKYKRGYPSLSAFVSSDPVFHAYRSFSTLRNRLLLLKQNELSGLEMELNNLDEDDAADLDIDLYRARDYKNGSEKRRVLIEKIESADKEYVSLLQNQAKMLDFPAISNRDREGHMNWLWNTQALVPKEMQYIRQDDVVSLYKREDYTPLEVFVERVIGRICGKFLKNMHVDRSEDENVYLYSSSRIRLGARLLVALIAMVMVVVPMALMDLTTSGTKKMLIVVLFTAAFALSLVPLTHAKKYEVFAATATYCAVFVVFGNGGSDGGGGGGGR